MASETSISCSSRVFYFLMVENLQEMLQQRHISPDLGAFHLLFKMYIYRPNVFVCRVTLIYDQVHIM